MVEHLSGGGAEERVTEKRNGDLSVTALYTSAVWAWGGLPGAELLRTKQAEQVFGVVNAALFLARFFLRGSRSLRHSLLHRHAMIDHLLGRLLREAPAHAVLELAAGLSRRGLSVTSDASIRYTEVDLPAMVARKRVLLSRSAEGTRALARPNWRLLSGEVTTSPLEDLAGPGGPLFVIAEGLCMYLSEAEQAALWRRVAALLRERGGTFVFDLVPACEQPRPGAVGAALEWLMKRFTGGKAFTRDERSRGDLVAQLRAAGFSSVVTIEPAAVAKDWDLPFAEVPTQQLLFVCRP
jgi:O-methyltransferase involved in polyketide biosynthesis